MFKQAILWKQSNIPPESLVRASGAICRGHQKHLPAPGFGKAKGSVFVKAVLTTMGVDQQVEANRIPWCKKKCD